MLQSLHSWMTYATQISSNELYQKAIVLLLDLGERYLLLHPLPQLWDKHLGVCDSIKFIRSALTLFILKNNIPSLAFGKGTISICSNRYTVLLQWQSFFTSIHWKTFCHVYKYLILLLPWLLKVTSATKQ